MDGFQRIEVLLMLNLHVFQICIFVIRWQRLEVLETGQVQAILLDVFGSTHNVLNFVFVYFKIGVVKLLYMTLTYVSYLNCVKLILVALFVLRVLLSRGL